MLFKAAILDFSHVIKITAIHKLISESWGTEDVLLGLSEDLLSTSGPVVWEY
jgi:hypothetical protein